jgi:CheY-like chemotaxis protein
MNLVAQASKGREPIQQFRQHRPDIALTDLQLPDMSGIEAMIAIRPEFPEARIIVLTTYAVGRAQERHQRRCLFGRLEVLCVRKQGRLPLKRRLGVYWLAAGKAKWKSWLNGRRPAACGDASA